jgi:Mlc titration factor MtfA (ptsG expression regulator)
MIGLLRRMRRRRLAKQPFPQDWLDILKERVPFFRRLSGPLLEQFLEFVKIFANEKYFTPAGGMVITDEVRVVISACAVRLILYLDISYYDRLTEIIVYPYVYRHPEDEAAILGEADAWGTVVLSWPTVLEDLAQPEQGHDTASHEFAHVLDRMADGIFDGTPRLKTRADYRPWAQVMSRHFLGLRGGDKKDRSVLRMYGATNEAEFFAVATEAYFEKSRLMKRLLPDLYEELRDFYGGDPAAEEEIDMPPAPGTGKT